MLIDHSAAEKVQPSFAAVFAQGLTDPARAIPVDVVGPRGKAAIKRYNVYRNNVTVSLIDALAATYPAVQRITGVEFFRAMAAATAIAETPSFDLPANIAGMIEAGVFTAIQLRDVP
jgi:Putative DNA-binding domain